MSGSVLWSFVKKDLFFASPLMVGAVICGIVSLGLIRLGPVGAYAAMILMICAGAAPVVFLIMYSVVGERKERSALLMIGLPVSTFEYSLAKLIAATISFLLPWAVLALGAFIAFHALRMPTGVLPVGSLFWVFSLDQFAVMLAMAMLSQSEALMVVAIVIFNVSISFYIFAIMRVPAIGAHVGSRNAVWNATVFEFLAVQAVVAVVILALLVGALARRKDFY